MTETGEAPISPTEERLGQFVADALDRLRRGESAEAEDLLADRPDLIERGRELVRNLAAFPTVVGRPLEPPSVVLPQPFPREFLVTRVVGEGTYGRVLLAEDLHLPRQVALKTLRVPSGSDFGEQALAALRREAGFLVGVDHPNVVKVYAWRESGDDHYLVLEYVSGGSFADLTRDGPLSWTRAARYVADVSEGLMAVHAGGVVHRDIKPGNILWNPSPDEAKLTDFGVAGRLTDVGTVTGTPAYMAPEAFRGHASEASDVYGLAATLFRLVAGEVPFRGANREELVRLIEAGLPDPDPRLAVVPESLERVLRAGLAADPARRPTLREFADGLRGAFNQSLADDLAAAAPGPDALRLAVSREVAPGQWEPVAVAGPAPERIRRDMRRVPQEPDRVRVRTGEWVRVELTADRDGYVAVFNVGPTGNLNLLYPDHLVTSGSSMGIRAGRTLVVTDVVFDPPAGRERVFAVWSQEPLALTERELRGLAGEEPGPRSRAYRASRDMRRVREAVIGAGVGNCRVAVLELVHESPGGGALCHRGDARV